MFDQFDVVYVVNLPDRTDRRCEIEGQIAKWSIDEQAKVEIIDGIRPETATPFSSVGAHGIYLCYVSILELEKDTKRHILVLEDDCVFKRNCQQKIEGDWDIFYGGYEAAAGSKLVEADIIGAHCMGFAPSVIPDLLDYLRQEYQRCAREGVVAAPIDGAIVNFRRSRPDLVAKFKKVSYQRSSRSDIGGPSILDRAPGLAKIVRRMRNSLRAIG